MSARPLIAVVLPCVILCVTPASAFQPVPVNESLEIRLPAEQTLCLYGPTALTAAPAARDYTALLAADSAPRAVL